jgi:hypothetical protein
MIFMGVTVVFRACFRTPNYTHFEPIGQLANKQQQTGETPPPKEGGKGWNSHPQPQLLGVRFHFRCHLYAVEGGFTRSV